MFDRVTLGVADLEAARRFYATVLPALGRKQSDPAGTEWGDLALVRADDDRPVTRGLHLGFAAPSHAHVDAFHRAGVDAGYRDDGAPGPRPEYGADYYGGFLLDPDGNSAEAVVHDNARADGIDHLWIRVADLRSSRARYEELGRSAGFAIVDDRPGRTRFSPGPNQGSFTLVDGDPPTTPFGLELRRRARRGP